MSATNSPQSQHTNKPQEINIGRRDLIRSSYLAFLASTVLNPDILYAGAGSTINQTDGSKKSSFFRWNETYKNEDIQFLYYKRTTGKQLLVKEKEDKRHMLFFYDVDARKMVNPINVKPTLQPNKYSMEVTIRNFHASKRDYDTIWKKYKRDAQMHLALTTSVPDADDMSWTLMNGIDIFLGGKLEGLDERLRPFLENNKPTSKFRQSARIEVHSGNGEFQIQIAAQRKKSIWQEILSIGGAVLNAPLFATLPIPKLVPQSLQFVNAVLDHLESTEKLTPIWTSAKIPFTLYNGASKVNSFVFRPGFWTTIDRNFAEQHLDANQNLGGVFLNLGGQFFELVTTENQPVDANYSVIELDFPIIKS